MIFSNNNEFDKFLYARKALNFLQFHRSCKAEVNTSKFLLAIENNKEPKDCCDIDICAPDAINYAQGTYRGHNF